MTNAESKRGSLYEEEQDARQTWLSLVSQRQGEEHACSIPTGRVGPSAAFNSKRARVYLGGRIKVYRDASKHLPVVASLLLTSQITGIVREKDEHKVVVAFTIEGEEEEREFYRLQFNEMSWNKLRPGARVLGRTALEMLPNPDEGLSAQQSKDELDAIWERAEAVAQKLGQPPDLRVTREAQKAADARLAEQDASSCP